MLRALVRALDAGGGVEGAGIRPPRQPSLCICTVIITPSPYSQFYDPEGHVSCGYLLAFQEARILLVRLLLARLIRDTWMLLNESMKPGCVRFQGY
jgi:hypothetical protein